MSGYDIAPGVSAALARFELPLKLGFGAVWAPVMYKAEWMDGRWGRGDRGGRRRLPRVHSTAIRAILVLAAAPVRYRSGLYAAQFAELLLHDSLLVLGRHMGFEVHERRIAIDELLSDIAAVDAVAAQLRDALLAIQERRAPDPFGWTREVSRELTESI